MPHFDEFETEEELEEFMHEHLHKEYSIALTRNEALYLDDCLTLMVEREINPDQKSMLTTLRGVAHVAYLPVPIELIDKIAFAVLYTTDDASPVTEVAIKVDSSELYLLREVAQSYIKVGEEPVGFNIKRKLYRALYEEEYQKERMVDKLLDEALPQHIDILTDTVPVKDIQTLE